MGHQIIGVGDLVVERDDGERHPTEPTHHELHDKADGEEHRRREPHAPTPHRRNPVEYLHARWDGDERRGRREEHLRYGRQPYGEHMVRPHHEA